MDLDIIERFVNSWLSAWNTHNVEAVLAHFAEDVTFSSPVAARVLGGDGTVRGKAALRAYWTEALTRVPDLRFELVGSYAGVDCLVIHYRNQVGGLVNEVLVFDGPLVVRGYGTYLTDDRSAPAGID
ncbi:nuclear transport factor 2 family protein [Streptacidiphilus neutrinimicus]|uniref:nuclear transport factor 2 family protein n=1 Tax=Streptacidiphilus neutrinimicus TaxID=105420 RepID=UPI0005AAF8F5|nr:nuclear transport factor 2 family protein [Streptacidiphilus neutrinimicus]